MLEPSSLFAAGLKRVQLRKAPSKGVLIGVTSDLWTPTLCKWLHKQGICVDYSSARSVLVASELSRGRQVERAHPFLSWPAAAREAGSRDFLFSPTVEFEKVTKPLLQPPHALKHRYCPRVQRRGRCSSALRLGGHALSQASQTWIASPFWGQGSCRFHSGATKEPVSVVTSTRLCCAGPTPPQDR